MKVISFKNLKKIFSVIILITVFVLPTVAHSDSSLWENQTGVEKVGSDAFGEQGEPQDIREIAGKIINVSLGLLGTIFLILLVIGGYQYMVAGGNEEQVKNATSRIKTAVIGLVIILAAWSISMFILPRLDAIVTDSSDYREPYNAP